MVTTSTRENALPRLGAQKTAQRVASPAVVIGLGSTGCQIVRRLEEVSTGWSFSDRKSLGYLYMAIRSIHTSYTPAFFQPSRHAAVDYRVRARAQEPEPFP